MSWLILITAGFLEVVWVLGLKHSSGPYKNFWLGATVLSMSLSLYLLFVAMKTLPASVAYSVWVAVGVLGVAAASSMFFHEPLGGLKLLSLYLIVAGVLGLKLST